MELENTIKFNEPVTAVSVHKELFDDRVIIAVGFESGSIEILAYNNGFTQLEPVDSKVTPADKINRLRWSSLTREGKLLLGVASADTSVRIYSVNNGLLR